MEKDAEVAGTRRCAGFMFATLLDKIASTYSSVP